jgi:hypothetical protein
VLERAALLGFPSIALEPPAPSFLGVYLWRSGFWDLFPHLAPRRPLREPGRGSTDRLVELTRFTDLAGAVALGERLPAVLGAAEGSADVPGGHRAIRRLANAVFELAENTAAHSQRLAPGTPVVGYYMAQRMPRQRRTFLAIGDLGSGIPATLRPALAAGGDQAKTDLAVLRRALEPGVSGSGGGGNGLYVARAAACAFPHGVMTVESGAALLRMRADGSEEQQAYAAPLPLTRVSFMLGL